MRLTLLALSLLVAAPALAGETERTHYAGDVWSACVASEIPQHVRSAANAQEVIDAAKGACESWRQMIVSQALERGATRDDIRRTFRDWDEDYGPRWTKAYLDSHPQWR